MTGTGTGAVRDDARDSGGTPGERRLRLALAAVFYFGVVGTFTELLLLSHFEERSQLIPLVGIVFASLVFGGAIARPRRRSLQAARWAMAALAVIGVIGVVLHFRSNLEFEREMDSSLAGLDLLWPAVRGAMPALAPAQLVQIALIGFLFTLGHPALQGEPTRRDP